MDWSTLELAVERVLESRFAPQTLSIVWHAGEPLVLPVDWYDEAFARIDAVNSGRTQILHHVQTNGVLINDQWIDLFRRCGVRVGLSLDGPARLHDLHRKTRNGSGTHRRVMNAVRLLNSSNLEYHVICVLTSAAMDAADEMHEFFLSCGIQMLGFNVEEIEGIHTKSSLNDIGMAEKYRRFLRRFLELSKVHRRPTIRELGVARNLILNRKSNALNDQQIVPLQILTVGVNGDISTFSPELLGNKYDAYGDFVFGNVKRNGLDEVVLNQNFMTVNKEIQSGVSSCSRACAYFKLCGGGAPANKLFEVGRFDVTETMFCRLTRQVPVDIALEDLEAELGLTKATGFGRNHEWR